MSYNIIIVGAQGRMGQMLIQCASEDKGLHVLKGVDVNAPDINPEISQAKAIIDFSHHDATLRYLEQCRKYNVAAVIGTTGHTETEREGIHNFAKDIPIVYTSNYSTGMNTLFYLVKRAAEILGDDYDQEVFEMHHRMKKDAPSGSALSLAEVLASVKNKPLNELARHGRHGMVGARSQDEIGIHSFRGGDIVGDHRVFFSAMGEQIELSHRATSREAFARGALRASKWVGGKPPGIYSMQDVLELGDSREV